MLISKKIRLEVSEQDAATLEYIMSEREYNGTSVLGCEHLYPA